MFFLGKYGPEIRYKTCDPKDAKGACWARSKIQTDLFDNSQGSTTQIKECASILIKLAKNIGIPILKPNSIGINSTRIIKASIKLVPNDSIIRENLIVSS